MGFKSTLTVLFVILSILKLSYAEEEINFSEEPAVIPEDDKEGDDIEGRWGGYHRRPSYGHHHHHHHNSASSSAASSYSYQHHQQQHHSGSVSGGHSHHHGSGYLPVHGHGIGYGSQLPVGGYPIGSGYEPQIQHRPGYYGNQGPIGAHGVGHYGQIGGGLEETGLIGPQNFLKGPGSYAGIAQDHYINKDKDAVLHGHHQGLIPGSPSVLYPHHDTPKIQFTSVGPNGRPAVSYTSKNFGFYFRNRNAVEDAAKAEEEAEEAAADSSAVQY